MTDAQETPSHGIRLVVFDLGRVLIRICDDFAHACREAGVAMPPNAPVDLRERRGELLEIINRNETGRTDLPGFCEEFAGLCGVEPDDVRRVSAAYLRGPFPGGAALIDAVNARGVTTACLSNTNAHHWSMMTDPGHANYLALDRLDHRFASHLVGVMKPDAAIYAHVERATAVPAGAILFFDDAAENIAAARDRGWIAERITDRTDPVGQMRDALQQRGVI